jgi:hypothetical protein
LSGRCSFRRKSSIRLPRLRFFCKTIVVAEVPVVPAVPPPMPDTRLFGGGCLSATLQREDRGSSGTSRTTITSSLRWGRSWMQSATWSAFTWCGAIDYEGSARRIAGMQGMPDVQHNPSTRSPGSAPLKAAPREGRAGTTWRPCQNTDRIRGDWGGSAGVPLGVLSVEMTGEPGCSDIEKW